LINDFYCPHIASTHAHHINFDHMKCHYPYPRRRPSANACPRPRPRPSSSSSVELTSLAVDNHVGKLVIRTIDTTGLSLYIETRLCDTPVEPRPPTLGNNRANEHALISPVSALGNNSANEHTLISPVNMDAPACCQRHRTHTQLYKYTIKTYRMMPYRTQQASQKKTGATKPVLSCLVLFL
jgi:hypothetical protein